MIFWHAEAVLAVNASVADRRAKVNRVDCEFDEEVGELADREHRAAEYQSERSADVAQQRQPRVGRYTLDQRELHLREEYLQTHRSRIVQS